MAFAMVVAECILSHSIDRDKFREIIVDRVFTRLNSRFNGDIHLNELKALIIKALDLAISGRADTDAILILGEGWVADETLAIAIFSVMRYIDDFEKCACCAVNHSGDSDSTGAVAGNIIGAILGYNAIPEKYRLESRASRSHSHSRRRPRLYLIPRLSCPYSRSQSNAGPRRTDDAAPQII